MYLCVILPSNNKSDMMIGLFLCLTQGMYWLQEVVLGAALRVVPQLARDVGAVLIEHIVWFSLSPVGVVRPLVTLLPPPVTSTDKISNCNYGLQKLKN